MLRAGRLLYLLILTGIVLFVIAHGRAVDQRLRQLDQTIAGPATAAAFESGEQVPRFLSPWALDSFLWVDHARQLAANGAWRLRWTHFDNAPEGRPVRWSSGLALWLVGLGQVWASVSDTGIEEGIERAAVWACPILFLLCVALLSGVMLRHGGALAASVLAIAMLVSGDVYGGFLPGEPDHHGLTSVCALGTLLGLVIAHSRAVRFGMVFSAVWGALGLWISAVTQSLVFLFIGLGIVAAWVWRSKIAGVSRASRNQEVGPELVGAGAWRLWGAVGALLALALYVLEYVPDVISWHVEVNHPLYAIAWMAGAEIFATIAMLSRRAPAGWAHAFAHASIVQRVTLLVCLPLALGPAIAVLALGERAHAMRNPFLADLHGMISELQPFTDVLRVGDLSFLQAFGILPLVAIAGAVLALRPNLEARLRSLLALCLIPLAAATVLRLYQVRWGVIWGGLAVAMAVVTIPLVWNDLRVRWGFRTAAIALGAGFILAIVVSPYPRLRGDLLRARMGEELTVEELRALLTRDIALQISSSGHLSGTSAAERSREDARATDTFAAERSREDARATDTFAVGPSREDSSGAPCVLAGPESSVLLSYFGGVGTVGTLYWENVAGLRAAADIATAGSNHEAFHRVRHRGVTHVVVTEWEDYAARYYAVLRPNGSDRNPNVLFARRIMDPSQRPAWLAEVPYPTLPQAAALELRSTTFAVIRS